MSSVINVTTVPHVIAVVNRAGHTFLKVVERLRQQSVAVQLPPNLVFMRLL